MSGDDIVDELQFRVTVTRLGGQHTAREVMSDIMAMENARAEIVRLRAECDDERQHADRLAGVLRIFVPYWLLSSTRVPILDEHEARRA